MLRYELPIYKLPRDGAWVQITNNELREMEKNNPDKYQEWDKFLAENQKCPIGNFLAHGTRNHSKYKNDGLSCQNDYENDLILVLGPNQCGKTVWGTAYTILHGLIPTDPGWPVFAKHGVEYREWMGPKLAIVASWSWDNVVDLYNTYVRWLPRREIPKHAPFWGAFEGEDGVATELNFGAKVAKTLTLKCGSKIIFLCYTQQQIHWEGKQCDIAHLDEQCPEDKFDGLIARQLTRGAYTPIIMTLTGHILPGRPDTGAGGWIKTKMIDQNLTKGRKFRIYHLDVPSTPEAIMTKEKKMRAKIQWVDEPERTRNMKKINEGIARYLGGWEVGGGLVLDEFHPDIHMIDPFDFSEFKPTYYRIIDHGKDPCAALLFARLPWGDTIGFKEYYMFGKNIEDNSKMIVENLCGNQRRLLQEYEEGGRTWQVYEEVQDKMPFESSELDGRSFAMPSMERTQTIGMLWNMNGCECHAASGLKDKQALPLVKEYLSLRKDQMHIDLRLKRKHDTKMDKFGAPSMYFFRGMENLVREINSYLLDPQTLKPKGRDVHLIDCLKYYCARDRGYRPQTVIRNEKETERHNAWTMGR